MYQDLLISFLKKKTCKFQTVKKNYLINDKKILTNSIILYKYTS